MVGWYHTGPRIREADLDISALMASYCENPLLVITEVEVRAQTAHQLPMYAAAVAAEHSFVFASQQH